jgi:hypothetical protein
MTQLRLQEAWYEYLEPKQRRLVELSLELFEREHELNSRLADYSFIVFPMAKAYEGFLKLYFYDLMLIDRKTFESRRFRIGRALNPDVSPKHHDRYWLFDDLTRLCGQEVARQLWDTWLQCRNQVFHFFPTIDSFLSLKEAGQYLTDLADAMHAAVECERGQELYHRLDRQQNRSFETLKTAERPL